MPCEKEEMNMKKIIILTLCLAMLLVMVGCGNARQNNEEVQTEPTEELTLATDPTTEEPTSQAKWYLTQLTDDCAASVELPDFIMEDDALKQFVCDYIEEKHENCNMRDFSLSVSNDDVIAQPQDYDFYLDIDCRLSYFSDDIASIIFEGMYNGKTAAHPVFCFYTLNIDRRTNEQLKLYNLIPTNDALYAAFVQCAYQSMKEKADPAWLAGVNFYDVVCSDRDFTGFFYDRSDAACAYFTETGIGISYPVSHPLGDHQETEIPYSVVGITKPEDALEKPSTTVTLFDGRFTCGSSTNYLDTYQIYDKSGAVVAEDTFKYFQFYPLDDSVLAVFVQAGNTIAARGGFFYDFANDRQSERFHYIVGFSDTLVVTAGSDRVVIVQSIFDDSFYLELSDFEYPLANSVEWLQDAELSPDGKSVTVTYLSGEHYERRIQIFKLH